MPETPSPAMPDDRSAVEAGALRELARNLHDLIPTRRYPDQALQVHVSVDTPAAVHTAAARAGRPGDDVEVHVDRVGNVITQIVAGFGIGSNPDSPDPVYANAATLTVAHVAFSDLALDTIDDVLGGIQ